MQAGKSGAAPVSFCKAWEIPRKSVQRENASSCRSTVRTSREGAKEYERQNNNNERDKIKSSTMPSSFIQDKSAHLLAHVANLHLTVPQFSKGRPERICSRRKIFEILLDVRWPFSMLLSSFPKHHANAGSSQKCFDQGQEVDYNLAKFAWMSQKDP